MTNNNEEEEQANKLGSQEDEGLTVKKVLKMPIQIFFVLCVLLAIVGVGPFTFYCYQYIEKAFENKPDDYEFPNWKDFKWTLLSVAIISIMDFIAHITLNKLFRPFCKI